MSEREHYPMELRTYTHLWQVDRRLYRIGDINLPFPLSLRQVGAVLAFGIPWIVLLKVTGVPFAAPWHVFWIVPPCVVAWYANQPLAEGKGLIELLVSRVRFMLGPKRLHRMRLARKPCPSGRVTLYADVWHRTRSDGVTGAGSDTAPAVDTP